jgi:hypothetical protein
MMLICVLICDERAREKRERDKDREEERKDR